MGFFKILFFLLLTTNIFANNNLKKNYYINTNNIFLSEIVQNADKNTILFTIPTHKHSKRVKSKELIKLLKKYGYKNFTAKHSYIQFSKTSPIDTSRLREAIIQRLKENYKHISIESILVMPRVYIQSLPEDYRVILNKKMHLRKDGILSIKTMDNKKIFFNYSIKAKVTLYKSYKEIQKGEELSNINTRKKSIMLDNFKAMPLQEMQAKAYEAKHRIKSNSILTTRDIVGLYLVKRGSVVSVTLQNAGMEISFSAKALQSGQYGSSISVLSAKGKKIKVIVTGKNRVIFR